MWKNTESNGCKMFAITKLEQQICALTASLSVFDENLDLQQSPRYVRFVTHQRQANFELLLNAKLYATVFDLAREKRLYLAVITNRDARDLATLKFRICSGSEHPVTNRC